MDNLNLEYPKEEIKYSMALGSETFLKKIEQHISSYGKDREIQATHSVFQSSPEKIIALICSTFQISPEEVLAKRRGNTYRILTLYLIKNYTSLSLKKIGEIFSMDYTAVSQAARRFEGKISTDKNLKKSVESIRERLNIEMSNVKT